MLGDDYISQHVRQAYREYVECLSYRSYMADAARNVEALLYGSDARPRWYDIIEAVDAPEQPEPPREEPEQVKNRLLAKINGKEEM